MIGRLILGDGSIYEGSSFGKKLNTSGEVVFTTGMVGYTEALTDPSYSGQILVFTYPLIGNYGVFDARFFESNRIHAKAIVVCSYASIPSHFLSQKTLGKWLEEQWVAALEINDTRHITQKLRTEGTMLGRIVIGDKDSEEDQYDPNLWNLVSDVSCKDVIYHGSGRKKVILIDCGAKKNIIRCLLKRDIGVIQVPWDFNFLDSQIKYDGILISNGPGDPKKADKTIEIVKKAINRRIPTFGICLGHQILALAAGGDTYKLKYGHRSHNQPCILSGSNKCFITTQNHGFAVGKIPVGFHEWFRNVNDDTNEGIIHDKLPFMSVQFHPESCPGPQDTEWIFDEFIKRL